MTRPSPRPARKGRRTWERFASIHADGELYLHPADAVAVVSTGDVIRVKVIEIIAPARTRRRKGGRT